MSEPVPIIEWGLAERTAGAMLSIPRGGGRSGATAGEIARAAADGVEAATAYAGLGTPTAAPPGELIDRGAWSRSALATLRDAAAPVERRLAEEIDAPGPLGPALRRSVGAALGIEVGVAAGYAAGRVLGQLDFAILGAERPPRLLFIGENIERARVALDADHDTFLRWIALHEGTHVVQFECVGWLTGHVRKLAGELIEGAASDLDTGSLGRLGRELLRSPRELVRALLRGELARLLAHPERRAQLDRLQATMSVIEGHAEHVMDAAATDLGDELTQLRDRLDRRRARRGGLGELVGRLLGFEAKMRQYELGKAFCDAVATAGGPELLRAVWASPAQLPDLAELGHPDRWLERVGVAAAV